MAALITDKDTVRLYVDINFINDNTSLPNFELVAQRFLVPIIGQDLYDVFSAAPDDDPELRDRSRAVIAPLGYLIKLPTIQTQITDSGLKTVNTDTLQAAHRWEYNEVKEKLADDGAYAMEVLLKFLFDNKDDYPEWTGSQEYEELNSLIFQTATDFDKYFKTPLPHRLFWELRPLIREVQDFYVNSAIGEDFFDSLKDEASPSDEEKKAIEMIKKSVAQLTIVKSIEKMGVKITPKGFVVLISADNSDAANSGDIASRDPQLSLLYDSCERSGDAYLLQLKEYLNNNASASIFTEYFESDYYEVPPTTVPASKNACRHNFGL
jgi:hypothetical protein